MLQQYLPIVFLLVLCIVVGGAMLVISALLPKLQNIPRYDKAKMGTYECGIDPVGSARERFSVKFYMVAMLFILFDIEIVFLYPWAVVYQDVIAAGQAGMYIFWSALVFTAVLLVGLIYAWRTGALRWD